MATPNTPKWLDELEALHRALASPLPLSEALAKEPLLEHLARRGQRPVLTLIHGGGDD